MGMWEVLGWGVVTCVVVIMLTVVGFFVASAVKYLKDQNKL
jgi:hypothetical protein